MQSFAIVLGSHAKTQNQILEPWYPFKQIKEPWFCLASRQNFDKMWKCPQAHNYYKEGHYNQNDSHCK